MGVETLTPLPDMQENERDPQQRPVRKKYVIAYARAAGVRPATEANPNMGWQSYEEPAEDDENPEKDNSTVA